MEREEMAAKGDAVEHPDAMCTRAADVLVRLVLVSKGIAIRYEDGITRRTRGSNEATNVEVE